MNDVFGVMAQEIASVTFQLLHGRVPARSSIKQQFDAPQFFRVKRKEFIQIVWSETEWIGTSPNEQCRPTDLVITNSNAKRDCGLIIKYGELGTVVLVKTNKGLCLDFRQNPCEIVLFVRVEARTKKAFRSRQVEFLASREEI